MDNIIKIISAIVTISPAVLAWVSSVGKLVVWKKRNREEEYYDKILCLYFAHKRFGEKNKETAVEYINSISDNEFEIIPSYIFSIVFNDNMKRWEKELFLDKVLTQDYFELSGRKYNKLSHGLLIIDNLVQLVLCLASIIIVIVGTFIASPQISSLLLYVFDKNMRNGEIRSYLRNILLGLITVMIGFGFLFIADWLSDDRYTLKNSDIEKKIEMKIKRFDETKDEYFHF